MGDASAGAGLAQILGFLSTASQRARAMSISEAIMVIVVTAAIITGGSMQLISLNFWLEEFPAGSGGGPFTVLTISSVFFVMVFLVVLILALLTERPNLAFLKDPFGWLLLLLVGLFNSLNGVSTVYATQDTPEFMQAILFGTSTIYTLIFSKLMLKDKRSYFNVWVIVSVLCLIGGVVVSAIPDYSAGASFSTLQGEWTGVFAAAFIPGALYNVIQAVYMNRYTDETNGNSVKAVMLFVSCVSQVMFMFILLPMDALPWWGTSPSLSATWENLVNGWRCIHTCPNNAKYFILFNVAFTLSYISGAIMNKYSPPLSSMISQLVSPVSAVLLLTVPAWNVDGATQYPGPAAGAIVLILFGSIIYAVWEAATRENDGSMAKGQPPTDWAADPAAGDVMQRLLGDHLAEKGLDPHAQKHGAWQQQRGYSLQ